MSHQLQNTMFPLSPIALALPTCRAATVLSVLLSVGLAGCSTVGSLAKNEPESPLASAQPKTNLYSSIPKEKLNTAPRMLAAEGIKALDAKDYKKASDLFNLAVKTDMSNSYLHFLNAVAYQMRGLAGESNLFPLAEQGFEMATQFDASNWLARYYSGLLAMQQRDFAKAKLRLADAALYAGNEPELLYDLAVAAYYDRDPKVAAAALEGLRIAMQARPEDPTVLRASAIVAASLNNKGEAENYLSRLRKAAVGADDVKQVELRVDSWLRSYQRAGMMKTQSRSGGAQGFTQTQFPSNNFPGAGGNTGFPSAGANNPYGNTMQGGIPGMQGLPGMPGQGGVGGGTGFVEKQMAVVDVSIISTEEDNTQAMGVNLLDGLKIQFGNPLTQTPAFSQTNGASSTTDYVNPANSTDSSSSVITRLIQVPALTYSLNIANANAKRNEVLARPTLVALGNMPSNFFSGQDIVGAAVSGGQGSSVQIQKEVGVKLSVTPEFLPDNLIKLNVIAERTFLAIPSTSVKFDFRLDTNKTMVNANVVMKFGETLILSGLSERDQTKDRDGVPLLQDVPIVQYLFSRNVSRDYYKSVLILLTPRRTQYTNRAEADIAAERATMTPGDVAMAEFEDKFKPWFKPTPNVGEITKALESGALFREFRTGDIAASWTRIESTEERLRAAVRFLYY
jgi:Flp pilus assembly protein TadD